MNQNELWNAQCFFRQLAARRAPNDCIGGLSTPQRDFYEKITHYYGRVPQDIQEVTVNMLSQLQKLVVNLIPLYQVGFRFDIHVGGGSLRDLMLGNQQNIKDLDIIVSINEGSINTALKETPLLTLEAILGKEIHDCLDWNDSSQLKKVHALFCLCLKKEYKIERGFTIEDMKAGKNGSDYDELLNQKLSGIITVHNEVDKYPMDILLTKASMEQYMASFNFEICKTYVKFFCQRTGNFLTNPVSLLENIHVTSGFIEDGMNKTITFNMALQPSLAGIENSIKNHLPRIVAKYPEHQLILKPGSRQEYIAWKQKYEDYILLHKTLPHKEDEADNQKKVVKI